MESPYAFKNPEAARRIVRVRTQARTMGTKKNYMSSLTNYFRFALNNGVDPVLFPIPPLFLQFWISDRAGDENNVNSLSTWTAMIGWLHELCHEPKTYKNDGDYQLYIGRLKKQYRKAPKKRLPIRLYHLIEYAKALGAVPGKYDQCSFNDLMSFTLALVAFFTASRPSEIVKSADGYNESGLICDDLGIRRHPRSKKKLHWLLTVKKFKNQQFRAEPKIIPVASAREGCKSTSCVCKMLDPYRLLARYMVRKAKLAEKKPHLAIFQQKSTDALFIFENGKEVRTTHLGKIAKHIAKVNAVLEPDRFTGYSFRIGGTTLASIQGIEKAMILQYVKWSEDKLPDASHHYILHSEEQLSLMARRMLHGRTRFTIRKSDQTVTKVYDPWATSLTMRPAKQPSRSRG